MPRTPNTVLLSVVLNDLTREPAFLDAAQHAVEQGINPGTATILPLLERTLRFRIGHVQWAEVDHFPAAPVQYLNPMWEPSGDKPRAKSKSALPRVGSFVDVGEYGLERRAEMDLDRPSTLPGIATVKLVTPLGSGAVHGDGANPALAGMHSESARLAEVLNRLAMNRLEGTVSATASLDTQVARTPEELVRALQATGHEVTVADARTFANFAHLHYEGKDVMAPFWVDTEVALPVPGRRALLVPVSQAELEWKVRGPRVNADVAFYFGVDGKAEFRTMDTLNQAWVMGRHAHEYRGAAAVEATRLAGLLAVAYMHAHEAHPELAFGGYYALGVCQDGVSAIEKKMTGKVTLFPNTANMGLLSDARDGEIDALLAAVPKDWTGKPPELERIFGSLPTEDLGTISIPLLGDDLMLAQKAWKDGTLGQKPRPRWPRMVAAWVAVGLALVGGWWIVWRRRVQGV